MNPAIPARMMAPTTEPTAAPAISPVDRPDGDVEVEAGELVVVLGEVVVELVAGLNEEVAEEVGDVVDNAEVVMVKSWLKKSGSKESVWKSSKKKEVSFEGSKPSYEITQSYNCDVLLTVAGQHEMYPTSTLYIGVQ
jgi:hypothetical protein